MASGGKLAATFTSAQRMQMIQSGYNPLNPEDVKRFMENKQPLGELREIATTSEDPGFSFNSMGEKHMSYTKDYGLLKSQHGQEFSDDVESSVPSMDFEEKIDPRKLVNSKMGGYGNNNEVDLNLKLQNKILKEQPMKKPNLIQTNKPKTNLITEQKEVLNFGHQAGLSYLNAFIKLLKNPSSENRENLIKEINSMILKEEKVHPNLLEVYKKGIAIAEKKLYERIKKNE